MLPPDAPQEILIEAVVREKLDHSTMLLALEAYQALPEIPVPGVFFDPFLKDLGFPLTFEEISADVLTVTQIVHDHRVDIIEAQLTEFLDDLLGGSALIVSIHDDVKGHLRAADADRALFVFLERNLLALLGIEVEHGATLLKDFDSSAVQ